MTRDDLITACRRAIENNNGLTLVGAPGVAGQPVRGFRAELLCVNSEGCRVWRYSPGQVRRLLRLALGGA